MRVAIKSENPLEWLAHKLGLVPDPLIDTQIDLMLARTVMAGVKVGVFTELGTESLDVRTIADRCEASPEGIRALLLALESCGYVERDGDFYRLSRMSRRWLWPGSRRSLHDKILFQYIELAWLDRLEHYVVTGEPHAFHRTMGPEEWRLYQRGMKAVAQVAGREVARRTPAPRRPHRMLDLGGSHGHFAAALCRRHKSLTAVVLDLPEAIEPAAPLLAEEGLGGRVVHEPGDVRTADLGEDRYDLVLLSNLAHHLSAEENADLARRVARALKPGGVFAIQDAVRPDGKGGQFGALLNLYFAFLSRSGTWAVEEMATWQRAAGLTPLRAVRLRTAPGFVQQAAQKPR